MGGEHLGLAVVAVAVAAMVAGTREHGARSSAFTLADPDGAAGLRPDVMPIVSGEFKWIALMMADD